jgi:uncharacterized protein with NRDE domain
MCLLAFAAASHPAYRLVLAANRDEFHARPTARAAWWGDDPHVLGGRDLTAGGTWLGVTRDGRWAAVTNVREPGRAPRAEAPSRGALVADFLREAHSAADFIAATAASAELWNGFNLLCGDAGGVWWLSNRAPGPVAVPPGVHAVSNALLDTPWPKVAQIRADLELALSGSDSDLEEHLFQALARRDPAAVAELPATGVEPEVERALSSAFIDVPGYGTRASTVLRIAHDGLVSLTERSWRPGEGLPGEVRYEFRIDPHRRGHEEATPGVRWPHPNP